MLKINIYKNLTNINKYSFVVIVLSMMIFSLVIPTAKADPLGFITGEKKGFFGLNSIAEGSGFKIQTDTETGTSVAMIIGRIIGIALSFLGIIFMILIVYGGFMWMMARGNEAESKKAKDILINASIGVIIVFSAFAISDYIVAQLYTATQTPQG